MRPPPIFGQQPLGQHADNRRGELGPDLILSIGRKDVDDAIDRSLSTVGVQRAEDDMPGFGGVDRGFDRRQIAQFAHQNHIRVLPQRTA